MSRISFSYPVEVVTLGAELLASAEATAADIRKSSGPMASASELRSSVESVKMEDVRLLVDDKNAEAALRSSSRSDTVNKELPIDLVAAEHEDNCMEVNQSSTVPTEQNPDSQEPLLFHKYIPVDPPEAIDDEAVDDPDEDEKEDKTESS